MSDRMVADLDHQETVLAGAARVVCKGHLGPRSFTRASGFWVFYRTTPRVEVIAYTEMDGKKKARPLPSQTIRKE